MKRCKLRAQLAALDACLQRRRAKTAARGNPGQDCRTPCEGQAGSTVKVESEGGPDCPAARELARERRALLINLAQIEKAMQRWQQALGPI